MRAPAGVSACSFLTAKLAAPWLPGKGHAAESRHPIKLFSENFDLPTVGCARYFLDLSAAALGMRCKERGDTRKVGRIKKTSDISDIGETGKELQLSLRIPHI